MTLKVPEHDVRYDYGGRRLTCRTNGCREATLAHQPYMRAQVWQRKVREFVRVHPPKQGKLVYDGNERKPTLTVQEVLER